MASKAQPAKYDCYHNALPDEPMFVLLARDPAAPALVKAWANGRFTDIAEGRRPPEDQAMVVEALDCAAAMIKWREKNDGVWRMRPVDTDWEHMQSLSTKTWQCPRCGTYNEQGQVCVKCPVAPSP